MTKYFAFLIFILVAIFYICIAPIFIQGGDTAELVNASYNLFVPHPPGYPLFLWLQHIFTHAFPVSSVFWRASILSALLGLSALAIVIYSVRKNIFLCILIILGLGLSRDFIEASVLPDVFSLHALLVAYIGYYFLFSQNQKRRAMLVPFFFFLGAANHLTIVFLLPCLLGEFWESKKNSNLRPFIIGAGVGITVTAALYLSLFYCQPGHPLSWGNISDFPSLLSHMMRSDYGTFQLASGTGTNDFSAFSFLLRTIAPFVGIFIISAYFVFKHKKHDLRMIVWSLCLFMIMLFPLAMNVKAEFIGMEILKRFHVMPLTVLILWILYALKEVVFTRRSLTLFAGLMIPFIILNALDVDSFLGLRNDSLIEDYSRRVYAHARASSPSVIMADNDSSFFGIRYVQSMFGNKQDDVAVISPPLLFHRWFVAKIKDQLPSFQLKRAEEVHEKKFLNLKEDVVENNLPRMSFVVFKDYKEGDSYKVTFNDLGRVVQAGKGVEFGTALAPEKIYSELPKGPQQFTKGYLYYQYAHYYLAHSAFEMNVNKVNARNDLEKAVSIVPYALPAMVALCTNFSTQYEFCEKSFLEDLQSKIRFFY